MHIASPFKTIINPIILPQAYYFERDDVALPGFYKFFKKSSDEEREHAEKFMKYQNQRGGRIVFQNITVSLLIYLILQNIFFVISNV